MKILYCSASRGPHDRRFLSAIESLGHRVQHIQIGGVEPTESVGDHFYIPKPASVATFAPLFKKVEDDFSPDVVHAGPIQSVLHPVSRSTNRPLVGMSWGSDLLAEFTWGPDDEKLTVDALRACNCLIADCSAVGQAAQKHGYAGPIVRFPWGVDIAKFFPGAAPSTRSRDTFRILSIRNWEDIYDVSTVARAFQQLATSHSLLHLVMAGRGSHESQLRAILEEATERGQVTWQGHLENDQLPSLYQSVDLYVSASLSDGSSISLLEAMASGLPTVVSDIPGNREWVDLRGGELFECQNPRMLAEKIRGVLSADETARCEMGKHNRKIATERADWSENLVLLNEAYNAAISRHAAVP